MEISANAFSSGLSGIQAGQRRAEQAAGEVAGSTLSQPQQGSQIPPQNPVDPAPQAAEQNRPDLAQSLVALLVGEYEVRANARVVETADEVLGTLVDIRA